MASAGSNRPALDLRVLGPVRLLVDDQAIALPGAKLRALLAMLVINRRNAVAKTTLANSIWEEEMPNRSVDGLYAYVSNLRTILRSAGVDDRSVLRTVHAGYLLDIAEDQCDVGRFERARTQGSLAFTTGDLETAAECFADALAQWSGEAVAGLRGLRFADNFATDMDERRLNAIADRLDADIACGREGAVLGELTALTAEHAVNERLWRLFISALYRAGRQADALAACLRIRRNLADEQGIDPDPRTLALEQAIRSQQALPTVSSSPGATKRDLPDLLRQAWLRVGDGEAIAIPATGLRIGREWDNDIVLDDARVSRKHARIVPRDNRIFIRDRDSANGVYVNGVPIGADTALADGDVIRIGSTTLRYEMPDRGTPPEATSRTNSRRVQ
ncbi:BTAD domain-containing putative transcriptional regulator [Nocardia sp. NPDC050630]|uniref:BTAD domain-containing putative transcriptional regulator n=1 Tax=Nocardia sp. NPDC050630 TaxID=3364321 RepID=UPI0037ABFD75